MTVFRKLNSETTDENGNIAQRVVIVNPNPADAPGPTDITLSNDQVLEGASLGTLVGTFVVTNGLGPFTFTEIDDPDNKFTIVGNELQVDGTLDFNTSSSHNYTVEVEDANNNTFQKTFVITVLQSATATNKKVTFNGIDEAIFNTEIQELNGVANRALTICFTVQKVRSGVLEKILSRQSVGASKRGIEISFDTDDRLHFKLINSENGGNLIDIRTNLAHDINDTLFYTITYNGSQTANGVNFKRNAGAVGDTIISDTLTFDTDIGSDETFFGAQNNLQNPFQGSLNHIMIFNRVLTNSEITELYNGGAVLEDLSGFSALNANILHVPINNLDVYPTLVDQRGNYNLTMNANMSQSNIVDA